MQVCSTKEDKGIRNMSVFASGSVAFAFDCVGRNSCGQLSDGY